MEPEGKKNFGFSVQKVYTTLQTKIEEKNQLTALSLI